jgi:PAS domain S-box-containing protein
MAPDRPAGRFDHEGAAVTDGREIQQALDASEERFRRIFEASQIGLLVIDPATGLIESVNPTFCTISGYSEDELVGRDPVTLMEGGRSIVLRTELMPKLLRGELESARLRAVMVRPDGERVFVDIVALVVTGPNGTPRLVGTIEDRTSGVRAENELRESEARFRALFESATIGVLVCDVGGMILEVNEMLAGLVGEPRAEIVGRSYTGFVLAEDLPEQQALREALVRGDRGPYSIECRILDADENRVPVRARTSLVRDEAGEPLYLVTIVESIAEQRHLEEQFRQAQKMEAVGLLAGGVAHDFNNLLTIISGYAAFLLADPTLSETHGRDLNEIVVAASRAADLTRQLLAFSRKQVLRPRILEVNEAVVAVERLLRRVIGEDVEVVSRLSLDLVPVLVDPTQIEQVLMNLVLNARDAMPEGGTVEIATRLVYLDDDTPSRLLGAPPGQYVAIAVSDNGTGMDNATLARIFEPFFTTKAPGRGTGLGLATVYGIVQQSGGDVSVESQPGLGSTFIVYLPIAPVATQDGDPGSREAAELVHGRGRILLVEDDPGVRGLAGSVLDRAGYDVLLAEDAAVALDLLDEAGTIDLLVTDLVMPSMSGPGLAGVVRERQPALPVLFVSGYSADVAAAEQVDPEQVLEKPFSARDLTARVAKLLQDVASNDVTARREGTGSELR